MSEEMAGNVAAFEQTVRSTIALAETFGEADWDRPTELPGWTVKDIVSHLVGVETLMVGEDPAPGHTLPEDPPHVRNDLGRAMEPAVDHRRGTPGPRVLAELRAVLDRRMELLPAIDPDRPAMLPIGREGTYTELMAFRAFDCWAHEQDIRRAVGRPGNLDAPAAERTLRIVERGLPMIVAKRAAAAPGTSVTFEVTGPVAFTRHVTVGPDGHGAFAEAPGEDATVLRMDWETFLCLVTGRRGAAEVTVEVHGDEVLAGRVLGAMALAP
ncbi:maleylpyruvate isomerase family mycothiol-dependent enzyme [Actinomadura logoneensis]|uniref:Maleylpyruvate isomerase family mycothiol-dependent enzyme n=1 Tax=Actinomadura logoneensis TaxID=2293572 RepID=A0A372JKJ4_9ACTN|nr:maleylpyruvate isomerase family mycothiol-dependent enzyme [Actinomadura logoneensis]RFU40364.1 maleylpyruvate isomerase family mycothiol-dependent enzyme [Actinomadura logoneensis]